MMKRRLAWNMLWHDVARSGDGATTNAASDSQKPTVSLSPLPRYPGGEGQGEGVRVPCKVQAPSPPTPLPRNTEGEGRFDALFSRIKPTVIAILLLFAFPANAQEPGNIVHLLPQHGPK